VGGIALPRENAQFRARGVGGKRGERKTCVYAPTLMFDAAVRPTALKEHASGWVALTLARLAAVSFSRFHPCA